VNDAEIIAQAINFGEVFVSMGNAGQWQMDKRREELMKAALAQPEPIEILTLPGQRFGEVGFKVRRFKR
jgi:hypothetical protein